MKTGDIIDGYRDWIDDQCQDGIEFLYRDELHAFYKKKHYTVGRYLKEDPQFIIYDGMDEKGGPVFIRELKPGYDDVIKRDFLYVDPSKPVDEDVTFQYPGPTIRDIVHKDDKSYYISDYFEGKSLASIVGKEGPIDIFRAVHWLFELIEFLWYTSPEIDIFINPHSVYVRKDGSIATPDFFFHSRKEFLETCYFSYRGTRLEYYTQALGALLYFMLTGHDIPESLNGSIISDDTSLVPDNFKIAIEYALSQERKGIYTFLSLAGIWLVFETEEYHDGIGRWFICEDGKKPVLIPDLEKKYGMWFYEMIENKEKGWSGGIINDSLL